MVVCCVLPTGYEADTDELGQRTTVKRAALVLDKLVIVQSLRLSGKANVLVLSDVVGSHAVIISAAAKIKIFFILVSHKKPFRHAKLLRLARHSYIPDQSALPL